MKRLITLIFSGFSLLSGYTQVGNNMCEGALPFCTGTSYSFPAGVNAGSGQAGPYYACLNTTPNPAWYYMKIALPGMIQITMYSQPAVDIDFCCWGPFDNQNACGQLTSNKVIDCSYSTAATEICDIPNAIAGKYYLLIITNYSNNPCNIIFSQTGGVGTTDCTILPPAASNNGPLCVGENLQLYAANMNNAVYHWTGPDGWTSNVQNPIRNNVQLSMAGIYSLFVTVNGQPSADTNYTNVPIYNKPTATLTGGGEICEGDSSKLIITCQNHPPWTVTMTANGQTPTNIPIIISPHILYVHPTITTTYALTQVSNEICNGLASGSATVVVNSRPDADFSYDNTCSGYATLFNDASQVTGGFINAWHWDFGNSGDTSNIQNPSYVYPLGGTYDVLLKVTSNKGCKGQILKSVTINATPEANAGVDKTIPYGTNTTLQGGASGGSGSYAYQWEPANLLNNPNIASPTTVNLSQTVDFVLIVTDQENYCQHEDIVTVTIAGGPMAVQVTADPDAVCKGSATTIHAQAGGGSGSYTYSWTSNPPGFTSTLEDITVQPDQNTTYMLSISDGFSQLTSSITITVYPLPLVIAGSPQTIPNGTTTMLTGYATSGTPPFTYSWTPANLVVTPDQSNTLTTLLSSTTNYILTVTDGHGCSGSSGVLITIAGGPLMVHPQAASTPLCRGESTLLMPMSEGGSGNYSYTWTAPGGFSSTIAEPLVTPTQTTTYQLVISDGFTTNTGEVTVIVNPLPIINLIPEGAHVVSNDTILACVFDTLTLSAANPNSEYLWSNGATTPEIQSSTTGIAFDMLTYSVDVSNTLTGCSNSAAITILFTYGECTYGMDDIHPNDAFVIFPNPGSGVFTCRMKSMSGGNELSYQVADIQGTIILSGTHFQNQNELRVDLTDQPAGVYFLNLADQGFIKALRIIKCDP